MLESEFREIERKAGIIKDYFSSRDMEIIIRVCGDKIALSTFMALTLAYVDDLRSSYSDEQVQI